MGFKEKSNISISSAIGDGIVVAGDRNVQVMGGEVIHSNINIVGNRQKEPIISSEQAFERIGAAVRLNLHQLERNIEQARKESSQFFKLTLMFSSIGFAIVLSGVGLLLANQVTAGIVASASSIIPEITAILFFKKDQELRKTIGAYHRYMLDSQQMLTMIDVAETIKNPDERDRMKQQIILRVLDIKPEKFQS
jgi:hypothetical protein